MALCDKGVVSCCWTATATLFILNKGMKLQHCAESHQGNVRTHNEDSWLVDADLGVYIVCDGVGGRAAGKQASEAATQRIHHFIKERKNILDQIRSQRTPQTRAAVLALIDQAINHASQVIFSAGEADPSKKGMATTAEVCVMVGDYAFLGHVGDSRMYLLRGGKVSLLTEDHSVVAEMVRKGLWTKEQAEKSPFAHTLVRAVGNHPIVQVDTLEVELAGGDTFVLCSDGLANYLQGPELSDLAKGPFQFSAKRMVDFALKGGGRDNVTTVVIQVEGLSQAAQPAVSPQKKTEILGQIPLFKYLTPRELTRVMSLTVSHAYDKGASIIQEGQPGSQIFIIVSGQAQVIKGGQTLAVRNKGEVLGEMAILDNAPRSASVITAEPTTCLVIQQKELFDLLRKESQLAVKVLWSMAQSLNQSLRSTSEALASAKSDLEKVQDGPFLEITPY